MSEPVGDYLDRLENTHDEHESLLKFLMGMGWKPLECDSIGFLRDYWQTRAALEARLSKMEELLYEAIEVGGAPESTWVDTDDEEKRAWPISDEEVLAGESDDE